MVGVTPPAQPTMAASGRATRRETNISIRGNSVVRNRITPLQGSHVAWTSVGRQAGMPNGISHAARRSCMHSDLPPSLPVGCSPGDERPHSYCSHHSSEWESPPPFLPPLIAEASRTTGRRGNGLRPSRHVVTLSQWRTAPGPLFASIPVCRPWHTRCCCLCFPASDGSGSVDRLLDG